MMGLTHRQSEYLAFIRAYVSANGCSPSLDEIAQGIGAQSKSTVHFHLRQLEARGYLRLVPRKRRSIELIERGASVTLSPHVERAVSEYARRHRTTTQVAANELLAEYLAKVAA